MCVENSINIGGSVVMTNGYKGSGVRGREIVPFYENACYNTSEASKILKRSVRYVRNACATGMIKSRKERSGYFISGWQLRSFIEGRSDLD